MAIKVKKIYTHIKEDFVEDLDWLVGHKLYENRHHVIDDALGRLTTVWKSRFFIYQQMKSEGKGKKSFKAFCKEKDWLDVVPMDKGFVEHIESVKKRAKKKK